jgi:hypothetical protein
MKDPSMSSVVTAHGGKEHSVLERKPLQLIIVTGPNMFSAYAATNTGFFYTGSMAPACSTTENESAALSATLHEILNTWPHRTSQHHAATNQLFLTPCDTTVQHATGSNCTFA